MMGYIFFISRITLSFLIVFHYSSIDNISSSIYDVCHGGAGVAIDVHIVERLIFDVHISYTSEIHVTFYGRTLGVDYKDMRKIGSLNSSTLE